MTYFGRYLVHGHQIHDQLTYKSDLKSEQKQDVKEIGQTNSSSLTHSSQILSCLMRK